MSMCSQPIVQPIVHLFSVHKSIRGIQFEGLPRSDWIEIIPPFGWIERSRFPARSRFQSDKPSDAGINLYRADAKARGAGWLDLDTSSRRVDL